MWPRRKNQNQLTSNDNATNPKTAVSSSHAARSALDGLLVADAETMGDRETVAFDRLRQVTHLTMAKELSERITRNPLPTDQERSIGAYVESIEPQVRNAVLTLKSKGYPTQDSGFHASDDNWRIMGMDNPLRDFNSAHKRGQTIGFAVPLHLTNEQRSALAELGAEAVSPPEYSDLISRIGFTPAAPDLTAITAQWDAIANVLPTVEIPPVTIDSDHRQVAFNTEGLKLGLSPDLIASSPLSSFYAQEAGANMLIAPSNPE